MTIQISSFDQEADISLEHCKQKPKKKCSALSFYRSQKFLGWSKSFVPDQKFIYTLWQSQTFCARQKDDLHSVKLVFVAAQKVLKRH